MFTMFATSLWEISEMLHVNICGVYCRGEAGGRASILQTSALPANKLMPLCLVDTSTADGELEDGNSVFMFQKSSTTELQYNFKGRRTFTTPSLSLKSMSELSVNLFVGPQKADTPPPAEATFRESDLVDGSRLELSITRNFSSAMVPRHLWPAGHIQKTTIGRFAAVHQNNYGVGIFMEVDGDFKRLNTSGFVNSGGENMGTVFEHRGNLYVAVRVNLRYIRSMGGHGWRYPGIYRLDFDQKTEFSSEKLPQVHGTLVVQETDDESCCIECGGCTEDKHFSSSCIVNSQEWWDCQDCSGEVGEQNLIQCSLRRKPYCYHNASYSLSNVTHEGCSFASYLDCVHKCRQKNELYHSAVTTVSEHRLMGMVSNRTSDSVSLCLLDNDSLRYFCYEKPLLNLTMVQHTHPVMSGLIESGERFVVLEAVTKDLRPFNEIKDPTVPTSIAHSWERHSFCSLVQRDTRFSAEGFVKLEGQSSRFSLMFSPLNTSTNCDKFCREATWALNLTIHESGLSINRDTRINMHHPSCTCTHQFDLQRNCLHGCRIRIRFEGIQIRGLWWSHAPPVTNEK